MSVHGRESEPILSLHPYSFLHPFCCMLCARGHRLRSVSSPERNRLLYLDLQYASSQSHEQVSHHMESRQLGVVHTMPNQDRESDSSDCVGSCCTMCCLVCTGDTAYCTARLSSCCSGPREFVQSSEGCSDTGAVLSYMLGTYISRTQSCEAVERSDRE